MSQLLSKLTVTSSGF